jgi:hypothetical protein
MKDIFHALSMDDFVGNLLDEEPEVIFDLIIPADVYDDTPESQHESNLEECGLCDDVIGHHFHGEA